MMLMIANVRTANNMSYNSQEMVIEDKKDETKDESSDEETCLLFMDGLPKDFSTNPQLAALASLMNGDDHEDDDKPAVRKEAPSAITKSGGGKLDRKSQQRGKRQDAPYTKPTKKKAPSSLGEAQLFLQMWSLK
jgi:hypothetical protein